VKRVFFFLLTFFLFLSCGKKLPPPSPDRIKPSVRNIYYFQDGKIKIETSENISSIDSIKIEYDDTIKNEKFYIDGKNIYLWYDQTKNVLKVDIFSISDLNGNKNYIKDLKVKGEKIKDTLPPKILKSSQTDTLITLLFSENVGKIFFKILPENIDYKDSLFGEKLVLKIKNEDVVQMVVDSIFDLSGNIGKDRWENYFFTEKIDEKFSLKLTTDKISEKFILLDIDGKILRENISDKDGNISFLYLKRGRYTVKGENFIKDTLILE